MNKRGNMNENNRTPRQNMENSGSSGNSPACDELLRAIDEASFFAMDLKLYLDTHPDDTRAVEMFREAVKQINRIRNRAGLANYGDIDLDSDDADALIATLDELTLLEEILNQKEMEFMGEGKRWYDVLWFGRIGKYKYKEQFIDMVIKGNETTSKSWIQSVLVDPNSWYMPLPQSDLDHNRLLEQNPYYSTSK